MPKYRDPGARCSIASIKPAPSVSPDASPATSAMRSGLPGVVLTLMSQPGYLAGTPVDRDGQGVLGAGLDRES